jgi:hypothetical protein
VGGARRVVERLSGAFCGIGRAAAGEIYREAQTETGRGGASLDAPPVGSICFPPVAMRRRPSLFRRLLTAGLVLGAAAGAGAQLPSKSPFLPATAAGAAAPAASAPLEFRGYMEFGGALQVRLFDPAKKTAAWVALNERNADLEVTARQLDRDKGTLTVEHRGAMHTLEIRAAKVVSGGAISAGLPPPVPMPSNVAPAVTQSVVVNPTPADEQRRLEAVASEVARRRALREQAQQMVNQAQAGAAALAPPAMPTR